MESHRDGVCLVYLKLGRRITVSGKVGIKEIEEHLQEIKALACYIGHLENRTDTSKEIWERLWEKERWGRTSDKAIDEYVCSGEKQRKPRLPNNNIYIYICTENTHTHTHKYVHLYVHTFTRNAKNKE